MKQLSVLSILHAYHNRGGTENHSKFLAKSLSNSVDTTFIAPYQNQIQIIDTNGEIIHSQTVPRIAFPEAPIHQGDYESFFCQTLDRINPDLIHIHHLLNWPLGILECIIERKIPFVVSLHDYYLVTPHFTMQGIFDTKVTLGANYAIKVFGADISEYLKTRRNYIKAHIGCAAKIIAPSKYMKRTFQSIFSEEVSVIPHAIEEYSYDNKIEHKNCFGFLGSFLPQKGIQLLIEAYKIYKSLNGTFGLQLFGGELSSVGIEAVDGVQSCGVYEICDLTSISSKYSVGIIPSIFPESFCLTLSEHWQMQKPVIAFAIGALVERLNSNPKAGWLVYDLNPQALAYKMLEVEKITSECSEVEFKVDLPSHSLMATSYNNIYSEAVSKKSLRDIFNDN